MSTKSDCVDSNKLRLYYEWRDYTIRIQIQDETRILTKEGCDGLIKGLQKALELDAGDPIKKRWWEFWK